MNIKLLNNAQTPWKRWQNPPFEGAPVLTRSHLGFALEVEGEDVLARPRLALTNHEEPVAPGPACKHQLSRSNTRQSTVKPWVTCQTGIALWLLCSFATTCTMSQVSCFFFFFVWFLEKAFQQLNVMFSSCHIDKLIVFYRFSYVIGEQILVQVCPKGGPPNFGEIF